MLVSLLVYFTQPQLGINPEIPGFGHPNPGIFRIKIRNKTVDNY